MEYKEKSRVEEDVKLIGVDEANTDFMYSNIWNKVFRHVLVKLENNHQLAHVLMK